MVLQLLSHVAHRAGGAAKHGQRAAPSLHAPVCTPKQHAHRLSQRCLPTGPTDGRGAAADAGVQAAYLAGGRDCGGRPDSCAGTGGRRGPQPAPAPAAGGTGGRHWPPPTPAAAAGSSGGPRWPQPAPTMAGGGTGPPCWPWPGAAAAGGSTGPLCWPQPAPTPAGGGTGPPCWPQPAPRAVTRRWPLQQYQHRATTAAHARAPAPQQEGAHVAHRQL